MNPEAMKFPNNMDAEQVRLEILTRKRMLEDETQQQVVAKVSVIFNLMFLDHSQIRAIFI